MNKEKKFGVIIISLVILITVSLTGGYYFNKFKTEHYQSQEEDDYTPPTAEEIEMYAQEFDINETRINDLSKRCSKSFLKISFFDEVFNSDKNSVCVWL